MKSQVIKKKLHKFATDKAGKILNKAVQLDNNENFVSDLMLRLTQWMPMQQMSCTTVNVGRSIQPMSLRQTIKDNNVKLDTKIAHTASKMELIEALSKPLDEGTLCDMETLKAT